AVRRIVEPGEAHRAASVLTSDGSQEAGDVLNCAGLHADRLAGALAGDMRIIPFRGYYAELRPGRTGLIRSHVYAAPDLNFPFLGVHLSRRTDGRVIVGPGAMLAFGREAYRLAQVQPRDLLSTLLWPGFYRMMVQPRFRALVRSELRPEGSVAGYPRTSSAATAMVGTRSGVSVCPRDTARTQP